MAQMQEITVGLVEILEAKAAVVEWAELRLMLIAQVAKIHTVGLQLTKAAGKGTDPQ